MPQGSLKTTHESFDREQLLAWTARRRDAIAFTGSAADIGRLLRRKARGRSVKTHRFFGEAFVVGRGGFQDAHYGSFKWLTNRRFADTKELSSPAEERLRKALHKHFTAEGITELQDAVSEVSFRFKRLLKGKTPTAPDLWLIGAGSRHRFIEVKLPGDKPAPHQLAGMAAISVVLGRRRRVSVEVLYLNNDEVVFDEFATFLTRSAQG